MRYCCCRQCGATLLFPMQRRCEVQARRDRELRRVPRRRYYFSTYEPWSPCYAPVTSKRNASSCPWLDGSFQFRQERSWKLLEGCRQFFSRIKQLRAPLCTFCSPLSSLSRRFGPCITSEGKSQENTEESTEISDPIEPSEVLFFLPEFPAIQLATYCCLHTPGNPDNESSNR
jgi:hypothetical protein